MMTRSKTVAATVAATIVTVPVVTVPQVPQVPPVPVTYPSMFDRWAEPL
jgi:hypothetical protein